MNQAIIDYSTLKSCLQKGISFAAYSLPGNIKFTFIAQREGVEIFDSLEEIGKGFIIYPFDVNKKHPILFIKNDFFLKEGDETINLFEFVQSREDYTNNTSSKTAEQSKEDYLKLFNQFKHVLDGGEFKKLVLSRVKNLTVADSFDIIDLFKKLNQKYPNSFNHLSFTPKSGVWLGASPELLLSINDENAKTVALAGTQKKDNFSNYTWDEKEIEEQKLVIDYIQNILETQFPKSSIKITNETIEAGEMVHLRTNFTFPSKHIKKLPTFIKELHPTPAVCGLPKEKAKQFILKNESHDRAYYSGFLGPINIDNQSHLFVNLRCLKFEGNTLSLFLGGGLTKNSIGEKEWEETELKATTLESLL